MSVFNSGHQVLEPPGYHSCGQILSPILELKVGLETEKHKSKKNLLKSIEVLVRKYLFLHLAMWNNPPPREPILLLLPRSWPSLSLIMGLMELILLTMTIMQCLSALLKSGSALSPNSCVRSSPLT